MGLKLESGEQTWHEKCLEDQTYKNQVSLEHKLSVVTKKEPDLGARYRWKYFDCSSFECIANNWKIQLRDKLWSITLFNKSTKNSFGLEVGALRIKYLLFSCVTNLNLNEIRF